MFWPIRRSILYFAWWRLVIRVLIKMRVEDRALLLFRPLGPEPTGFAADSGANRGCETPRGPFGPAKWPVSRGKPAKCQTARRAFGIQPRAKCLRRMARSAVTA